VSDLLAKALSLLPHGPEFRFVDRLLTLVPGRAGTGEHMVRGENPFLRGHFPRQPIFPGVLLVEAGAQLAGTVAQCDPAIPPMPGLKLTAIRNVKILGTAVPGEVIALSAKITGRFGNLVQAEISAVANGQRLMQGEVTLSGDLPK
jgi:3-hydroxyacyl-[acyl-carrier-protein] dehydratase